MRNLDHLSQPTRRTGSITYDPLSGWRGKSYVSQKTTAGLTTTPTHRWSLRSGLKPYGATWVKAAVMNNLGDPNSSRFECVVAVSGVPLTLRQTICQRSASLKVLVNNILIPPANATSDLLFRWYQITSGGIQGSFNQDAPYNGQWRPLRPYCAAFTRLSSSSLQDSTGIPDVEVLVGDAQDTLNGNNGRQLPVYDASGAYVMKRTDLLGDVVLDILFRSGIPILRCSTCRVCR